MKCPDCNFVCSDLRDICPKCLLDLRPTKRELGLRVTNPAAAYEALAAKVAKSPVETPSGAMKARPRKGFLSFFSRPTPAQPPSASRERSTPSQNAVQESSRSSSPDAAGAPLVETGTASEAAVSHEPSDFMKVDSDIARILDSYSAELPPAPVAESDTGGESFPPPPDETFDIEIESEVTSHNAIQRDAMETSTTAPEPPPPVDEGDPVARFFYESRREIPSEESISFGVEQFLRTDNRQDVLLMFDLSREALLDPESEKRYVTDIELSVGRKVEAEALSKQLERVEQQVNAPVLSLKSGLKSTQREREDEDLPTADPGSRTAAALGRVIGSAFIDLCLVLCMTALLTTGLLSLTAPELLINLYEGVRMSTFEVADLAALGGIAFVASLILYPLLTLLFFRSTIGMSVCNLELISDRGGSPSPSQALVRALSFPISIILGGWLGPTWGTRTLHDWLARTRVVNELPGES